MPDGYGYDLSEISTSNILEYRCEPRKYIKGTEGPIEEEEYSEGDDPLYYHPSVYD